jgi:uncharacterized SAM-binding protein YcdF (DUF218 family)
MATAPPEPADAIVVLGSPLAPDGTLGAALDERVVAGAELFRRQLGPLVVLSGRGEAEAMARRAAALGVPEPALLVEGDSVNTRQNAERSAALLAGRGARRVWIVSQPFHLRRASYWFRQSGLEPLPFAPAGGIQQRRPDLALRWTAREYGAWLKTGYWAARLRFLRLG